MKSKQNFAGFTLIELLVVIVIIGILATISVATFGGYFVKARDTKRKAIVKNIAIIIKTINASKDTVDYRLHGDPETDYFPELKNVLKQWGYHLVGTQSEQEGNIIAYASDVDGDDFVVATCLEETGEIFKLGTPNAVAGAYCTEFEIFLEDAPGFLGQDSVSWDF